MDHMDQYRQKMKTYFLTENEILSFLQRNHLNESFIDDHFSLFLNCYESVMLCNGCTSLQSCKQKKRGEYVTLFYDQVATNCVAYCQHYLSYLKEDKYNSNFVYSDIPSHLSSLTLDQVKCNEEGQKNLLKGLFTILDGSHEKGFYIYGDIGVGKTYLCIALANSLTRIGKKVAFIKTDYFVNEMRQSVYNDSLKYSQIVTDVKNADVIIFDDIGTETVSAFSRDDLLFSILDYRMENKMMTLFTSNLSRELLFKHYHLERVDSTDVNARRFLERIDILSEDYVLTGRNKRKL